MNGMEALTRLIFMGDTYNAHRRMKQEAHFSDAVEMEIGQDELSIAVATAMLNNGLPIARFRLHVTVDEEQPKPKRGEQPLPIREEFTVCGVSVQAVRQGILALSDVKANVQVSLWEQRATGADMVSAFQGSTKTIHYRSWLKEILKFNIPQEKVTVPGVPDVLQ